MTDKSVGNEDNNNNNNNGYYNLGWIYKQILWLGTECWIQMLAKFLLSRDSLICYYQQSTNAIIKFDAQLLILGTKGFIKKLDLKCKEI